MRRSYLLLLCLAFLIFSPAQAQENKKLTGETIYCAQREYYGQQLVRSRHYWQFHDQGLSFSDNYIVEYYGDTSICSRLLVDYERNAAYYQVGDLQYFYPLSEIEAGTACMQSIVPNVTWSNTMNE